MPGRFDNRGSRRQVNGQVAGWNRDNEVFSQRVSSWNRENEKTCSREARESLPLFCCCTCHLSTRPEYLTLLRGSIFCRKSILVYTEVHSHTCCNDFRIFPSQMDVLALNNSIIKYGVGSAHTGIDSPHICWSCRLWELHSFWSPVSDRLSLYVSSRFCNVKWQSTPLWPCS